VKKFIVFFCLLSCASACGGSSESAVKSTATTTTVTATTTTVAATTTTVPATTSTVAATTSTVPATTSTVAATTSTVPATSTTVAATTSTVSATTTVPATTTTDLGISGEDRDVLLGQFFQARDAVIAGDLFFADCGNKKIGEKVFELLERSPTDEELLLLEECLQEATRCLLLECIQEATIGSATTPTSTTTPTLTTTAAPVPSDVTPCRLKQAEQSLLSSGFPISSIRMPSIGSPRVAVLFVDFPDVNAVNSTESVFSKSIPGAEYYLETMSSGKLDLQFEPLHKWLRMSGELKSYDQFEWSPGENQAQFIQEAVDLADPDFDFSGIASVIIIVDENALSIPLSSAFVPAEQGTNRSLSADGNIIRNGGPRAAVLFVDFPNANAVNSTESVFSEGMQEGIDSVAPDFDLQFEPLHKWLRMSGEHESYDWLLSDDYLRFMQEAVDLADPDFDFSEIDLVAVIADEKALSFPSILAISPNAVISGLLPADGNQITNGVLLDADNGNGDYAAEVISHEMSHIMGLPDTYEVVDISTGNFSFSANHTHVGNFGIMGLGRPQTGGLASGSQDRFKGNEMLAWHRWQLGWIEDSEVFCATSSTTSIKLGPLTKNLDSRMLVMPVDSSRVIVAENRAIDGYDQNLLTGGILVYSVDERIAPGKGPIKVQGDYSGDWPDSSVLLQPGEKITVTGYEISVTSKVGNNYFIEISTP